MNVVVGECLTLGDLPVYTRYAIGIQSHGRFARHGIQFGEPIEGAQLLNRVAYPDWEGPMQRRLSAVIERSHQPANKLQQLEFFHPLQPLPARPGQPLFRPTYKSAEVAKIEMFDDTVPMGMARASSLRVVLADHLYARVPESRLSWQEVDVDLLPTTVQDLLAVAV